MFKIFFPMLFLQLSLCSAAQLTKNQIERLLTNDKSRTWEFKEYRKTLGNECGGDGQIYTFSKNGKVQRVRCSNKKRNVVQLNWQIVPVGNGESGEWQLELSQIIELENGAYLKNMRIDLPLGEINKKGKTMNWRVVPDCKICTEQVITFKSVN